MYVQVPDINVLIESIYVDNSISDESIIDLSQISWQCIEGSRNLGSFPISLL